jgi:endonuclease/exonuclease/phosphatase family metal-dependent hydrolase
MALKVLSYNIHHARGNDGHVNLERIAQVIRDSGADLAALQEVYASSWPRSHRQVTALTDSLGFHAQLQTNVKRGFFRQGNLILSRWPLELVLDEQLPFRGEHRGLLVVALDYEGREVRFANTHLGLLPDERKRQRARTAELIDPKTPTILAGDFNSHSRHLPEITGLTPVFTEGFSYSSKKPRKLIDNVLTTNHWTTVKTEIPQTPASDHLPLLATLDLA